MTVIRGTRPALHGDAIRDHDVQRILGTLHRLCVLTRLETSTPCERRNEKLIAVCEHVLDRKIGALDEVSEVELADVASNVGGLYSVPVKWGLLFRRR